jgi:GH25 family lysozyme M1 (1,4-beta-N-acetylmuramidase)
MTNRLAHIWASAVAVVLLGTAWTSRPSMASGRPVLAPAATPIVPGAGGVPAAGGRHGVAIPNQPGSGTAAAAGPSAYSVGGIDVSAYQPNVNWASVAAAGARFAYIKATEGTSYLNQYFPDQYHGAKNHGLFAGAYAFGRPDAPNPSAQADYLVNYARYTHDGRTLPLMLDLEWPYSGSGVSDACWGLRPAAMVGWIRTFVNRIRARTGEPMLLYTAVPWWNQCTGNSTAFGDQWLNIAYWSSASPATLPAGWSHWTFWQYAAGGALPGDQDVFNGRVSALAGLAGPTVPGTTSPQVVAPSTGVVSVYFEGADGVLREKDSTGSGWQWSTSIASGTLGGPPAVVAQSNGIVDAFWRGTDGGLWHMWRVGGSWYGPEAFGGSVLGNPSAALTSRGVQVVYTGTDATIHTKEYTAKAWQPTRVLAVGRVTGPPVAVRNPTGGLQLFWRGEDNRLWSTSGAGGSWAPPFTLGGSLGSDPAPVLTGAGVTDVFYRGRDGALWHTWRAGSRWFGPASLGGAPLGGGPTAAGQPDGVVDVFWKGADGGLWHSWFAGGRWYAPRSLGGRLDAGPSAAAQPDGVIDVFYDDFTRALGHSWYVAPRWYGPAAEGGFIR